MNGCAQIHVVILHQHVVHSCILRAHKVANLEMHLYAIHGGT